MRAFWRATEELPCCILYLDLCHDSVHRGAAEQRRTSGRTKVFFLITIIAHSSSLPDTQTFILLLNCVLMVTPVTT